MKEKRGEDDEYGERKRLTRKREGQTQGAQNELNGAV